MMLEAGSWRPVLLTSRVDGEAAFLAAAPDRISYPNDLDIDPWSEEGAIYFTGVCRCHRCHVFQCRVF